jgi:hypothetical protein
MAAAAQSSGGGFDWRVLASTLASGVENYQQERALRQQQDDIMQGQLAAQARQAEADKRVRDMVSTLRTSGPEPIIRDNMANYAAAIRASRSANNPSLPGNIGGERFQSQVAEGNQAGVNYADQYANTVANIDAPMYQRRGEHEAAARTGLDVGGITDKAQTDMYLAQLRASRRQPNPLITTLARLGQQFARNYEPNRNDGLEEIDMSTLPKRMGPPVSTLLKPMPYFDPDLQEIDLNSLPQKIDPYQYVMQHPTMLRMPRFP